MIGFPGSTQPEPTSSSAHPSRLRRSWVVTLVAAVLLAAAGGGVALTRGGREASTSAQGKPKAGLGTTTVTRRDISTGSSLPGSLGYGDTASITALGAGVVTWLPKPGSVLKRGMPVARIDDAPVTLFYGSIPLYRSLGVENTVGRDVRALIDNLRALGYDTGYQPSPGTVVIQSSPPDGAVTDAASSANTTGTPGAVPPETPEAMPAAPVRRTVHDGEGVLTTSVIGAVKEWQADLGLDPTGQVPEGTVVVRPGPVRVSSLAAQVGSSATGSLLSVSSTKKIVTLEVDRSQAATVRQGDVATVTLSDGSTTTARVTAIGTALATPDGSDDATPQMQISLALTNPAQLRGVDTADLQVSLVHETHQNVLTVPVTALLALSGGGYALQLPSGTLVPVTTGIFGAGDVEVSGSGVTENMKVVSTS